MKITLKKAIKQIKDNGHKYGVKFEFEKTEDKNSYIISNKECRKAALIGEVEIIGQVIVVSNLIIIYKWAWAEAEGFTRNEIIDKFAKEVFTEIPIEEIAENLVKE